MSKSGKLDSSPENYCSKQMGFKLPDLHIAFFFFFCKPGSTPRCSGKFSYRTEVEQVAKLLGPYSGHALLLGFILGPHFQQVLRLGKGAQWEATKARVGSRQVGHGLGKEEEGWGRRADFQCPLLVPKAVRAGGGRPQAG